MQIKLIRRKGYTNNRNKPTNPQIQPYSLPSASSSLAHEEKVTGDRQPPDHMNTQNKCKIMVNRVRWKTDTQSHKS